MDRNAILIPSLFPTAKKVARRERIKIKKITRNENENARDFMRVMHLYMRICIRKLSKCSVNDTTISMSVDCAVYYEEMVCKNNMQLWNFLLST